VLAQLHGDQDRFAFRFAFSANLSLLIFELEDPLACVQPSIKLFCGFV